MTHRAALCLGLLFLIVPPARAVPVGVASVDITPRTPVRLIGYASRKTESEGVENRLKARALAIGADADGPAVLITVDNCGIPAALADEVAGRLKAKAGITRDRVAICASHTHSAPCLKGNLFIQFGGPLPDDQQAHIDAYTRELVEALEKVSLDALANRKPGALAWSRGSATFAANRRVLKDGKWVGFGVNPAGPVDHTVPILRVTDASGALRAVVAGYACHCTTLGGEFNKICGDWSGFACESIERDHPGATALIVIGCGADANPEPRRNLDDARRHGATFAAEVSRLLDGPMTSLPGPLTASYRVIALPFGPLPTRDQLVAQSKKSGPDGYAAQIHLKRLDTGAGLATTVRYPVQTWCFGDALAMVFLGGEVVVDYAIRLNRECDANRLWVVAYANDVPCYIASKRLLSEGGYEVDSSMIYYGQPTRLAPEAEDLIIRAVHDVLPDNFDAPRRP